MVEPNKVASDLYEAFNGFLKSLVEARMDCDHFPAHKLLPKISHMLNNLLPPLLSLICDYTVQLPTFLYAQKLLNENGISTQTWLLPFEYRSMKILASFRMDVLDTLPVHISNWEEITKSKNLVKSTPSSKKPKKSKKPNWQMLTYCFEEETEYYHELEMYDLYRTNEIPTKDEYIFAMVFEWYKNNLFNLPLLSLDSKSEEESKFQSWFTSPLEIMSLHLPDMIFPPSDKFLFLYKCDETDSSSRPDVLHYNKNPLYYGFHNSVVPWINPVWGKFDIMGQILTLNQARHKIDME